MRKYPGLAALAFASGIAAAGMHEVLPFSRAGRDPTGTGRPMAVVPAGNPMRPLALSPAVTFTPTPTPAASGVSSPSLAGLASIGSGLELSKYLTQSWGSGAIPASAKPDDVGAFRFLCAPSHNAYDDPIAFPGQLGKSHLHTFYGNTAANGNSTYASLRTSGDSTCNVALNRSAYWIAAMMNGSGKVVMPDWLAVYYKRMPSSDPRCHTLAKTCLPLPRGLRYIFGYDMLAPGGSPVNLGQRWWNCDGPGAVTGHFATIAKALKGCPVGDRLGAVVVAPDCWNGRDLDSADHRSHMAYRAYGDDGQPRCPATHPYIIPQFQLGAWWTTDASASRWSLSSDMGKAPGTTLHADWFGAWEDAILERWTAGCIDKLLSCSGGDLGDGQQLKTTQGYDYPAGRPLEAVPVRP